MSAVKQHGFLEYTVPDSPSCSRRHQRVYIEPRARMSLRIPDRFPLSRVYKKYTSHSHCFLARSSRLTMHFSVETTGLRITGEARWKSTRSTSGCRIIEGSIFTKTPNLLHRLQLDRPCQSSGLASYHFRTLTVLAPFPLTMRDTFRFLTPSKRTRIDPHT
jgi:hypothetical protein